MCQTDDTIRSLAEKNDVMGIIEAMMPYTVIIGCRGSQDGISVAKLALIEAAYRLPELNHPCPLKYLTMTMKGKVRRYFENIAIVRVPKNTYRKMLDTGEHIQIEHINHENIDTRICVKRPDQLLYKELRELCTDFEFMIIESRMMGMTDREIAKELKYARSYIQKVRKKLIKKIKKWIE